MNEQSMTHLSKIADIQVGYAFKSANFSDTGGVRLLRGENISQGALKWGRIQHWPEDAPVESRYMLKTGDVVLAMDRPWVEAGLKFATVQKGDLPAYLVQRVARLRGVSGTDQRYINCIISSPDFTKYVLSVQTGTSIPHISGRQIGDYPVRVRTEAEQRAISNMIGALDDKIAANNACIRLIDEHLAAEYERAIQQEKVVEELGAIADFHNKRRIPLSAKQRDERPGTVPYYGASGVFGHVDEALFDEPLVLVGEDGSVINADGTPVTQYIWGPAWVNNHAHALKGKVVSTELLYYAIQRSQVSTLVTGAVQPKINMGNLKRLQLTLPAPESRTATEAIISAEVAAKRAFTTENRTLTATRDTLLPQLMSGKLRVKDAEKLVEESL